MKNVFQDICVLALEQAVAAPLCSCRLADGGARVIKVERAEGDFARYYDGFASGESSYFSWLNRGKESLVADIKSDEDAALLRSIIMQADVYIQNLAPGAAKRARLGSEEMRALNPRLITVDITGYGDAAGYEHMKAYDLLIQAESGLASVTGHPAGPGRVGVSICDIACGMAAYSGVLEALIERSQTGQGKAISISLFDAIAEWMTVPLLQYEATGQEPPRLGVAHPSICPYGTFTSSDERMVVIAIQNEREWQSFCADVLDTPDLPGRDGFGSNRARVAQRPKVDAFIQSKIGALSFAELTARLRRAGTAYGAINPVELLGQHPALRRVSVNTPGGAVSLVAPPLVSESTDHAYGEVPEIGQHSTGIRAEFAPHIARGATP
ncbi:CaiB/BaiF CoA transferase family protein [Roseovarius amoyensis]|uniref:CaiB/BaiF CoA transferase family protein n=1 Tax=Roseovarius amoyensis TaxID=2211448 RepID=UPI000DBE34AE|nr:CaiB/BaiF CoA-transferase family protein [Roseovarius amoyensis]